MKRIVKLIAEDKRYKDTPYPYRCIFDDNINTYLTGQHIDPRDPDTFDNLTVDEMTGKEKLSAEKKMKFPFIINPLIKLNLVNGQRYDLSKDERGNDINPKDVAHINLLRKYAWFIASSYEKFRPNSDYFYIHDEVFEAQERTQKADQVYEAQKFIREDLKGDGLFDIALVLSYKINDFRFDPDNYDKILLKDKILGVCEKNPAKILECKKESFKDDIYVLKLAYHDIIKRRGTDFYDESKFIGGDLLDVQKFIKLEENTLTVSKWNRLLAQKEGRLPKAVDATLSGSENKKETLYKELEGMSLDELKKYAGSKRYPKVDWGHLEDEDAVISYLLSKVY